MSGRVMPCPDCDGDDRTCLACRGHGNVWARDKAGDIVHVGIISHMGQDSAHQRPAAARREGRPLECTETRACEGGCWWVEPDLCSACVPARALSILQPWAWLIVHGHKDIENRSWRTRFRGRVLIHAGKRWGREQSEDLAHVQARFPGIAIPESFDLGGIVGEASIVDCVDDSDSAWFNGEFGFVISAARPLPFVACRGELGLFRPKLERTHA